MRRRTRKTTTKGAGPSVAFGEAFDFEATSACAQVVVDVWDQPSSGPAELLGKALLSIADCRAACAAHDASATSVASNASRAAPAAAGACHAWTLSKETSICWLKTANVTRTPVPKSRALVSGWL